MIGNSRVNSPMIPAFDWNAPILQARDLVAALPPLVLLSCFAWSSAVALVFALAWGRSIRRQRALAAQAANTAAQLQEVQSLLDAEVRWRRAGESVGAQRKAEPAAPDTGQSPPT